MEVKSHTTTGTWRPLRGALNIVVTNRNGAAGQGTATGIAYEGGGVWLITAAHLLPYPECDNPVYRCTTQSLVDCRDKYPKSAPYVGASVTPTGVERAANMVKWSRGGSSNVRDVAAAWIDDGNRVFGDASTCANRDIEGSTFLSASGMEVIPRSGDVTYMYCSYNHATSVVVDRVDVSQPNVTAGCISRASYTALNQITYSAGIGTFLGGCSGSPILTSDNNIVSMLNWGTTDPIANLGGGTMARYIRLELGFSRWYGTATLPNSQQVCQ